MCVCFRGCCDNDNGGPVVVNLRGPLISNGGPRSLFSVPDKVLGRPSTNELFRNVYSVARPQPQTHVSGDRECDGEELDTGRPS